jgi:hypothetical protein
MSDEITSVGSAPSAPPNPIADPMMPDEAVAAAITDAVPGTNVAGQPTNLGEHVYSAILVAIRRERNRVERVIGEIAADLMQKARAGTGEAQLAQVQGNERAARELEARAAANGGIATYLARFLVVAVGLPPGECRRCLGQKKVPSALAPGQAVPCPACSAPVNGVAST